MLQATAATHSVLHGLGDRGATLADALASQSANDFHVGADDDTTGVDFQKSKLAPHVLHCMAAFY